MLQQIQAHALELQKMPAPEHKPELVKQVLLSVESNLFARFALGPALKQTILPKRGGTAAVKLSDILWRELEKPGATQEACRQFNDLSEQQLIELLNARWRMSGKGDEPYTKIFGGPEFSRDQSTLHDRFSSLPAAVNKIESAACVPSFLPSEVALKPSKPSGSVSIAPTT